MYIIIGSLYNVWCYAHYPKLASTVIIIISGGVMWPPNAFFLGGWEWGGGGEWVAKLHLVSGPELAWAAVAVVVRLIVIPCGCHLMHTACD